MISVVSRKVIVGDELVLPWLLGVPEGLSAVAEGSFLTRAPMTPKEVRRRYSKGRDFEVVFRKGYRKSGRCAALLLTGPLGMGGERTI